MAITIRNKKLEADIKAIGAKYGKGPTDVLKQLVEEHARMAAERERAEVEALIERRRAAMDKLMAQAREWATDESRAAVRNAMDELYDENGLPR